MAELELELSRAARDAFHSHRYESCLSALNKLLDTRRYDVRVIHNRAVAQYLLSNLTHTDDFRRTLHSVNVQFDRDAEGSGETVLVSDKAVLLYNQALIHLRLHQNSQAAEILEQLFRGKDALSSQLAIDVCILIIEVYISTYQLNLASSHIDFIEAKLFADSSRENPEISAEQVEKYRSKLYLFKARMSLLHGNVKNCKKEIKGYSNSAGNNACAVLLKANVEYLKQNYHKSLKVLSSAPKSPIVTDAGECLSAFYLNNMACVHFYLSRHHLGAYYLAKAIEENDSALNGFPPLDRATPLSGRPLSVLGVNCRHILLYNLGLQQLFADQPLAAFDSLLEVVQVYHANPRLWLRLAEACMATHNKSCQHEATASFKSNTVRAMFGKGYCRKLVVAPMQKPIKSESLASQSAAMPAPTLEFSALCLKNALFLLSSFAASSSNICPTLPGPPICGEAITSLRCSILACLAYVTLGLGDPVSALAYSRQLLNTPQLPGGLHYLGKLYSAEALVFLERVTEAMQLLNPDSIGDVSLIGPVAEESSEHQPPPPVTKKVDGALCSIQQAKATMLYNLATAFCVLKEHDKAKQALQKAAALFTGKPPQLVLLSAYIELAQGNTAQALQIIHKTRPILS